MRFSQYIQFVFNRKEHFSKLNLVQLKIRINSHISTGENDNDSTHIQHHGKQR